MSDTSISKIEDIIRRVKDLEGQENGAISSLSYTALTFSGLTIGAVFRATGTTSAAFGQVDLANSNAVTGTLPAARGGTGVSNAGTLTNASNTTITGGGTLALGGFILTIPATGTAALLATANAFTAAQSIALDDAVTNATTTLVTLKHTSSGTPAAGFGNRELWQLESSTTADQDAAAVDVTWTTATHASRTSAISLKTVSSAGALTEALGISQALLTAPGDLLLTKGGGGTIGPVMYLESTSSGAVDSEFFFIAAGVGSSATTDGPYIGMRGNTFSRSANQRGLVFLYAGAPTGAITGLDGVLEFGSEKSYIDFQTGASLTSRLRLQNGGAVLVGKTSGLTGAGDLDANGIVRGTAFQVGTQQVVGARVTGWGSPTGVATRTTFDPSTVTLSQLGERVAALILDLKNTHGLIGA